MSTIFEKLKNPKTYIGIVFSIGGIGGLTTLFLDSKTGLIVSAAILCSAFVIAGIIELLTKDYAKTETKIDDYLNAGAKGVKEAAIELAKNILARKTIK